MNDSREHVGSQSMLDRLQARNKEPMIREHNERLEDKRGGEEEVKVANDLSANNGNASEK